MRHLPQRAVITNSLATTSCLSFQPSLPAKGNLLSEHQNFDNIFLLCLWPWYVHMKDLVKRCVFSLSPNNSVCTGPGINLSHNCYFVERRVLSICSPSSPPRSSSALSFHFLSTRANTPITIDCFVWVVEISPACKYYLNKLEENIGTHLWRMLSEMEICWEEFSTHWGKDRKKNPLCLVVLNGLGAV